MSGPTSPQSSPDVQTHTDGGANVGYSASDIAGAVRGLKDKYKTAPVATWWLVSIVFSLSVLGLVVSPVRPYIGLIPYKITSHIWTVLTCMFCDFSVTTLPFNCIALLLFGRVYEPMWSRDEFARFFAFVNAASGISMTMAIYVYYLAYLDEDILSAVFASFAPSLAAMCIVLKQQSNQRPIQLPGVPFALRMTSLPAIFLIYSLVCAVFFRMLWFFLCVLYGSYFAWLYLRFYQRHCDGTRGDSNPAFSLGSFFPDGVSQYVDAVGDVFAKVLGLSTVTNTTTLEYDTQQEEQVDPEIAERRHRQREKALKVLEEKLATPQKS